MIMIGFSLIVWLTFVRLAAGTGFDASDGSSFISLIQTTADPD